MVYNRVSWLNALSKVMKVPLEHEDAPVLKKYSIARIPGAARAVSGGPHRSRAVSGEVAPAQGLEGHCVQHDVRGHLQCAPAGVGAAAGVAPDGFLHKMSLARYAVCFLVLLAAADYASSTPTAPSPIPPPVASPRRRPRLPGLPLARLQQHLGGSVGDVSDAGGRRQPDSGDGGV